MTTQPEALLLADALTKHLGGNTATQAAAELRRLHEANKELLEACKAALSDDQPYIEKCRAAIAKAEEKE